MGIYRKIWEQHNGPIPKEADGRSYEIHHLDGNHSNNDISNLKYVTIHEHYDIHFSQGDYGACRKMAIRMKMSAELISELATLNNLKRSKEGTNPFNGPNINRKRLENGTHHLIGDKNPVHEKIKNGTHNFIGDSNPVRTQLKNGTHSSQKETKCLNCGRMIKGATAYKRFHGDKCKKASQ